MDYRNTDIAAGPVIADLGSADAAVALDAAATLVVAMQSGAILLPTADGQLVLPAGVGLNDIKVSGRDLIIKMPDGTQMVVPDGAIFIPEIVVNGVAVPPLNIAALLIGQEPQPAAGRPQSSGGNFADPVGDIGDAFALGDLLPPTQLAFPEPEEREIIPGLVDEEPTTIIITPDQPAGSVNATSSVQEAALPARETEPSGSNPSSTAETTAGNIVFDAPDGVDSVTLNGTAITAVGQAFVTSLGTLTITSITTGNIGYTYTLTDNTTQPSSMDVFAVVVTDSDGDTASANLTINIVDDVPTARNDTDGVAAGTYTAQTGNVVTGIGTTSGAEGADTQGADGAFISGARAGTGTETFAAVGTPIIGQYGTLIINDANGNYTYTRNPGTPGGVNDVFTYQLRDNDGDNATATLTIAIGDSPAVITFIPSVGEGTVVSEVGLPERGIEPAGSNPVLPVEATTGTITFLSPDGVASISLGGTVITPGALPQQVFSDATGTLVVTAYTYNPATGVGSVTYNYTLTDNTVNTDGTVVSFPIIVTDLDGDASPIDTLDITIVDDAPRADNDTAGLTEGGASSVTFDVDANDVSGADGTASRVFTTLSGTYGTITLNEDGTQTYTLNAAGQLAIDALAPGATLTDSFNYTLTDGDGDTDPATLLVTLTGADDPVVITNLTPAADGGDVTVDEDDLSAGSDATPEALTQAGDFTISALDGLDDLTVGTVNVIVNGVYVGGSATTPLGNTLTFTGYNAATGVVSYTYTLNAAETHANAAEQNSLFENFAVTLTDLDGSTTGATLSVNIIDDVPAAYADEDSVTEDGFSGEFEGVYADGNVITGTGGFDVSVTGGLDVNDTDGVADTQGADGATVTAVAFDGTDGAVDGDTAGAYGTLTLNADGSYLYVLNNSDGTVQGLDSTETLTEIFNYTITDADGDARETTLTITIRGSNDGVSITGLSGEGAEETLYEDDLSDGSSPVSSALTQTGSFDLSALDGVSTITVGGQAIFTAGAFVPGITIGTAYGTLTITGFTPVVGADGDVIGGNVTYEYVLSDNTLTHTGANSSSLTDSVAVVVTDTDGTSAPASLDIRIVDDVPQAFADTPEPGAENAPITVDVLANDTKGADGVAESTVAFVEGSLVGSGILINNNDGSFTYTPATGETGTVSFKYTIVDGDGDPSEATVTILLAEDSVPMVKTTTNLTVDEDGLANANVDSEPLASGETNSTESRTASGTAVVNFGSDVPTDLLGSIVLVDTPALDTQLQTLNGNDVVFALEAGTGDLVGKDGATEVIRIHITGAVTGPTLGDVTYSYTTTLSQPVKHTVDGTEDTDILANVTFQVTDSDSDQATGSFNINIVDDIPSAVSETAISVAEDAPDVGGNVLANDTKGADGATLTSVTVGGITTAIAAEGTTSYSNANGAYTFTAAGAWTFNPSTGLNNADGVDASFTYIITDGDGDTAPAAQPITITDGAKPGDAGTITLALDDQNLADGRTPAPPENNAATLSFGQGSDAISTIVFDTDLMLLNNANLTWERTDATHIVGKDTGSGAPVVTLELVRSGLTATVTATLNDNYDAHPGLGDILVNLGSVKVIATDIDGDTAFGTVAVTVSDDIPVVTLVLEPEGIATVDETTLGVSSGAVSFADTFDIEFNADGQAATGATLYALGVSAADANSGLVDVATGEDVLLRVNGSGVVEGYSATGGVVFTIAVVAATGAVTLTQLRAVTHPVDTDPNDALGLDAANLVTLTLTIKDGDDDTDSETANIGNRFTFLDDGPSVSLAPPPALIIQVDETDLAGSLTASGDLSAFITGIDYGSDGEGTTVYTLGIAADGVETLLFDTETGQNVVLTMNGDIVEGRTATSGDLVIMIEINAATGEALFTQWRAVKHADTDDHNDATGLGLASLVTVTATVTDRDGDSATATADVGTVFSILDDGPTFGSNQLIQLDDDTLDGNVGGTGDVDPDLVNHFGTLNYVFGKDTGGSIVFETTGAPAGFRYVDAGSDIQIEQLQGGLWVKVVTVTLIESDGYYTVTQNANILHAAGGDDETGIDFTLDYTITDGDGDSVPGTLSINVNDDTPVANAVTSSDTVDEDGLAPNGLPGAEAQNPGDIADDSTVATGTVTGLFTAGADTALTYSLDAAVSGLPALKSGGVDLVYSINTATNTLTATIGGGATAFTFVLNPATGIWTFTLAARLDHPTGNGENDIALNFGSMINATDADGDKVDATGSVIVTIDDDSPVAVDDARTATEAGLNPAAVTLMGNVLTNDTAGADQPTATVSALSGGTLGVQLTGSFGKLTLNGDGTYTYVPNASVAAGSIDTFTYSMIDADGDPSEATLKFTFAGDANLPTASAVTASVDDDGLIGNNPASVAGDLPDPQPAPSGDGNEATFVGNLGFTYGLDGAALPASDFVFTNTTGMIGTETVSYTWVEATGVLTATITSSSVAARIGQPLFTVTVNQVTGAYTLTLARNVLHDSLDGLSGDNTENDALTTLNYTVKDSDGSTALGSLAITFDDDTPTVTTAAAAAAVAGLDETATSSIAATLVTTSVKGNDPDVAGSGAIAVGTSGTAVVNTTSVYGADGAALTGALTYTLMISNSVSGLRVTDGSAITLVNESGVIVGKVVGGTFNGQAAFAISINATTGVATVEQYLSLQHPVTTNPDDTVALALGSLGATVTVTDRDGDSATSAIRDISAQIRFDDDAGTLGAFVGATILNTVGSVNGTFAYATGADGHGSFAITGPALTGITYSTVQNANGALLTATTDPDGPGGNAPITVFSLQVNSVGTYTFNLVTPQAASVTSVSLLGLSAGGPSPFLETADGRIEFTGSGSGVNSSTQGFGINNQFVGNGESFTMEFHNPGAVGDQPANTNPQFVDAVTLKNDNINGSLTITWTATNTVTGATQSGTTAVTGTSTLIDPTISFNHLSVVGTGGSGQGVRFTSVDISTTILPQDLNLAFGIRATDQDGDVTTSSTLNVFVDTPTPPVALDLDGDGAEFVSTAAGVTFDYAGDGSSETTAWVGADDGLLAFDRNSDGIVNDGTEIVFGGNGLTDLQGLAANYDSDHDGLLTAADDNFGLFGIWQDANSNGVTDAGEFQSLSDAGIVSIGLVSDGIAYSAANGEVAVAGQSAYIKADGSTGIVADAAFLTSPTATSQARTSDQIRSGNLTSSIVAASLVGLAIDNNLAATDIIDADLGGRIISKYSTSIDVQEPVTIADLPDDNGTDPLASQTDFAQRTSDVDSSLRVVDDAGMDAGPVFDPVSVMSELLSDSVEPVINQHGGIMFAGNDSMMHAMLDIAAFAPAIAGNDNAAVPPGADDAVRHAMPDMMIDRLIEAFTDGPDLPANDVDNGGLNGNDLLAGILDQKVGGDHSASYGYSDVFASHAYDLSTANT